MRLLTSCFVCWVAFSVFFVGCKSDKQTTNVLSNAAQYQTINGDTGWTNYKVTYRDSLKRDFSKQFVKLLDDINMETSTFVDTSVISKFNQSKTDFTLPKVSRHFQKNIDHSKKIHKTTNGFFDPSVMPLVNYWGFGYEGKKPITKIDSQKVKQLVQFVGLDKIVKTTSQNGVTLSKAAPEMKLDFSAIAKGYAVDCFANLLLENGIRHFMAEFGGEVVTRGVNAKGEIWSIGISTPKEGSAVTSFKEIIQLNNRALATSGNYRNYYEVDGKKYSHTIHPKTGYPERNKLLSASIIAKDCITADALATGCMTMGLEAAKKMVDSLNEVDALFIYTGTNESMEVYYTKGIEKSLLISKHN